MRFIVDCFAAVWNCVGGGGGNHGPAPVPEIDASNGFAAIALLLCTAVIVYRQLHQQQ
jgi:hypothetical protein